MDFDKFRIRPGAKTDLARRGTGAGSVVPQKKEQRLRRISELATRVDTLQDLLYAEHKHKMLIVLQGMDTSGKDGTIRHVFGEVDPLGVRAVGFRAPVGEETERDYLWRIHRQVPGWGEIVIFNRSHYEDVVVTRVHKWIGRAECERRYREINEFERMLADNGTCILKFFLHISRDEQRARLQERIDAPDKRWKFNPRDLEERRLWADYMRVYAAAIENTSKAWAPWYVVPADSKSSRNLIVSSILVETLESLKMTYPQPAEDYSGVVVK
ncbi:MAG: polyphosphate kinase 2 family protein [Betaproteobacteria bacterium]|nr:polyphosphate kinase 2 family protein [Betaproteobacteria bacterium]